MFKSNLLKNTIKEQESPYSFLKDWTLIEAKAHATTLRTELTWSLASDFVVVVALNEEFHFSNHVSLPMLLLFFKGDFYEKKVWCNIL